MLGSLAFYLFLVFTISGPVPTLEFARILPERPLDYGIAGFALLAFAAGLYVPAFMMSKASQTIPKVESSAPIAELARRALVPFVVRLVLFEAVVVLGFALAFASEAPAKILPFLLVTAAGFVVNYPSDEYIKKFPKG
jgi:hypothetical protein